MNCYLELLTAEAYIMRLNEQQLNHYVHMTNSFNGVREGYARVLSINAIKSLWDNRNLQVKQPLKVGCSSF